MSQADDVRLRDAAKLLVAAREAEQRMRPEQAARLRANCGDAASRAPSSTMRRRSARSPGL